MAELKQEHHGSGDNVGGDKYVTYHIHGQTRQIPHLLTSLPRLDTKLIGRETEMENLVKALNSGDKVLLVNGMGGVGKTTLAMAYANQFRDQYTHIAWVEKLDDLPTSLLANTVLLKNLDFSPSGDPDNDARILLNQLANLGGDSKSLLVIDNATEKLTPFKDDLPHPPHWHVLITSRENLGSFTKTIELDFLTEEKALELFFEHYKLDQDEAAAIEIISLVDRHTLTVELLARTAQERLIQPLARFADQLREQGLQISRKMDLSVLHSRNRKIEKLFPYLLAIFEWTPTSPEVERLLKQFVALPPAFISLDDLAFFTGHSPGQDEDWDGFTEALQSLATKGWIQKDREKAAYKMHRILQDVFFVQLPPAFEDLVPVIDSLTKALEIDEAKDNPVDKFVFVPFGDRLLEILQEEWGAKKEASLFFNNLALVYQDLGRFDEAARLLEQVLKSAMNNFGEFNLTIAVIQSNLALVYRDLGRFEEAALLLEQALKSDLSNFGELHPNVARSQSNLATVYQDLGRFDEAARLLERALKSDLNNFGELHTNVARSQSNLALVYQNLGRFDEAARLLEQALKSAMNNFGELHPTVARIQSNLALVFQDLGRFEEAARLLEQALKSAMNNFGELHPTVAVGQSNLALVYQNLGRFDEAARLLEQALKSDLNNFGELHPNVAHRLVNLAVFFYSLGLRDETKWLLDRALSTFTSSLGENHPNTKTVLNLLEQIKG